MFTMSVKSSCVSLTTSFSSKAEKCEFHVLTVSFQGFIVSEGSIQMDPAKVRAVSEWPTPGIHKEHQRFLGFVNFYRCIRNFSSIAAPQHALTSPACKFQWTPQADQAFPTLKVRFSSAPVLVLPDPHQQFVVEVDASDIGIGAVLSQRSKEDNKVHPCAFLSCKLTPAERNDVSPRSTKDCLSSSRSFGSPQRGKQWGCMLQLSQFVPTIKPQPSARGSPALLVQFHPWADISLDFVTGLPPSGGNSVILTIVDRFSRMVHFIPLPKLPFAKETVEVVLSNVFRLHGFPSDVVSDRGPQFVFRFWKEFCAIASK